MLSLVLLLLQSERPKVSKLVIIAAALALVIGIALVVYFYRRFKEAEKEPDETWQSGLRSLHIEKTSEVEKAPVQPPIVTRRPQAVEPPPAVVAEQPPGVSAEQPAAVAAEQPATVVADQSPGVADEAAQLEAARPLPAPIAERETQIFASAVPETKDVEEASPFDDEVFAGLETTEQPEIDTARLTTAEEPTKQMPIPDATSTVRAPRPTEAFERSATRPFSAPPKSDSQRAREPYEPPLIKPVAGREPYERPAIEPMHARHEAPPEAPLSEVSGRVARHSNVAAAAGSILGLPGEVSNKPLQMGIPSPDRSQADIGSLSNYGKQSDAPGGRTGSIVLGALAIVIAAAVLSYLYIPSLNSRVNAFVSRVRHAGEVTTIPPKAKVFPSRNAEVVKNMVKARGAVDNVSDPPEVLENLTLEISLKRGNGTSEVRQVPVTPAQLAPGQRGTYEFEYDGKRDTGFTGYAIVKLWAGDAEIKFTSPNQNR